MLYTDLVGTIGLEPIKVCFEDRLASNCRAVIWCVRQESNLLRQRHWVYNPAWSPITISNTLFGWDGRVRTFNSRSCQIQSLVGLPIFLRPNCLFCLAVMTRFELVSSDSNRFMLGSDALPPNRFRCTLSC